MAFHIENLYEWKEVQTILFSMNYWWRGGITPNKNYYHVGNEKFFNDEIWIMTGYHEDNSICFSHYQFTGYKNINTKQFIRKHKLNEIHNCK